MCISETVLITVFGKLVALELLIMTQSYRKHVIWEMLLNSLVFKASGGSGVVPKLRTLIYRLQYGYDYENANVLLQNLRTGIQRVAHSRQLSAPLWSASMHVTWPRCHDEFIVIDGELGVCEEEQWYCKSGLG